MLRMKVRRPPLGNLPHTEPSFSTPLARLERWLAQHRPRFLRALRPRATEAELDTLQTGIGLSLPAALRFLLSWHNGQDPGFPCTFDESWILMGTREIRVTKRELDASCTTTGWQREWIPFLDNQAGDYRLLDTHQTEPPLREFILGQAQQPVIAPSLAAWLEDLVTALERGRFVEDPERGVLLRRD